MLKRLFFVIVLVCLMIHGADAQKPTDIVQYTLPNGLKVYINSDMNMPSVYGIVAVKAGGKTDPHDNTGMAHYLEHMLFKGTEKMGTVDFAKEKPLLDTITALYDRLGKTKDIAQRKAIQLKINEVSVASGDYAIANDIDRLLNMIGSQGVNASTGWESTQYYNAFPPHELERWLDIYSHRFVNPVFRLFQSELETVYEEKNRSMDSYQDALYETFLKNFFKQHPYGQQTILGHTEHLKNPPLAKMYEYFNTYYVANNMALILSGPIDVNQAKTWIEQKFGSWRSGKVPEFPKYNEENFKGREFFEVRLAPIKIGVIGFRTPPNNHPDEEKVDVINEMFNNAGGIGFLDKLKLDNKILAAQSLSFTLNDYSLGGIFFMPKILKQSLGNAEELVMQQLKELRDGKFSDEFLEAIKTNMIKDHEQRLENGFYRAYLLLSVFTENKDWDKILTYPDRIRKITREDIIRAANQYYGDNRLVMYSKTGFPKKDKLEKPAFKPVIPKEGVKSEYAQYLEHVKPSTPKPRFVDFQKDVTKQNIAPNRDLYYVVNPLNNIFSIQISFGIGTKQVPDLFILNEYLGNTAPNGKTAKEFKEKMYRLGCEYSVQVGEDFTEISLTGLENNVEPALDLLNQLLTQTASDPKALDLAVDGYKSGLKLESGEPASMGKALDEYLRYGKKSSYVNRPSLSAIKKIKPEAMVQRVKQVIEAQITVHYVGKLPVEEVKTKLNNRLFAQFPAQKPSESPVVIPAVTYSEPTILFHSRSDARQCQIYFHVVADPINKEDLPMMDYFNSYFGDDMSSLVFQEVREYRSLAYSTRGRVGTTVRPGHSGIFFGYIGCQADKTLEAVDIMVKLITDMPAKTEREQSLREGLIQKAYTSRPEFRHLSESVAKWYLWGFTQDPANEKLPAYQQATFNDIIRFYNKNVKNRVISIAIVGNEKGFNLNALAKYGKIVKVKESQFYVR